MILARVRPVKMPPMRATGCAVLAGLAGAVALAVATAGGAPAAGGPLRVVAAEDVWGSIAAQLGGERAQVQSVIANPAADPHDYEPTPVDARAVAGAQLVIENGSGYDPWAGKLVAANEGGGRIVVDVGNLVGVPAGGNPHRWYSPRDVHRVIAAITAAYARLDPEHARYFARQRHRFETMGLAAYGRLIATIRRRYHGAAVGASESVVAPLARALALHLVTPPSFLNAISEGAEPTAADKETIDRQVARRQIDVWIENSQNATPDVARITAAARKRGIAVVPVTETIAPAGTSFQSWQVRQLRALAAALRRATGR
jgi:zinc/manganese transport system substrate-binding protein